MLKINNLNFSIDDKQIIKNLSLEIPKGKVHAIMGPNGSGKSTLSYILSGRPDYEPSGGSITFNGTDVLELNAEERSHLGIFLAFQYPHELAGITIFTFLQAILNAKNKAKGLEPLKTPELIKKVKQAAESLNMDVDMLKRHVNVGFSGGEKKRNEILQMHLLQPNLCILDETDSGLDIDALKIVADGVNRLRTPERSFLIITHYQRLLNYIEPDSVHIMANGSIIKSGDKTLAHELEAKGYKKLLQA